MQDFDVIFVMDQLSKYNYTVQCHNKKVVFNPIDEEKFELVGDPRKSRILIISALKEKQLLRSGNVVYLESIVDTSKEQSLRAEDVPVVIDYLEVFP